ncbi:MAG: hypothetical protein ACLFVU_09275 [Phycisphaerae bacterium]
MLSPGIEGSLSASIDQITSSQRGSHMRTFIPLSAAVLSVTVSLVSAQTTHPAATQPASELPKEFLELAKKTKGIRSLQCRCSVLIDFSHTAENVSISGIKLGLQLRGKGKRDFAKGYMEDEEQPNRFWSVGTGRMNYSATFSEGKLVVAGATPVETKDFDPGCLLMGPHSLLNGYKGLQTQARVGTMEGVKDLKKYGDLSWFELTPIKSAAGSAARKKSMVGFSKKTGIPMVFVTREKEDMAGLSVTMRTAVKVEDIKVNQVKDRDLLLPADFRGKKVFRKHESDEYVAVPDEFIGKEKAGLEVTRPAGEKEVEAKPKEESAEPNGNDV